jgi:hypothetical protein
MTISFKELYDQCRRAATLLERLATASGRTRSGDFDRNVADLLPLLAELGDFADDHDIDDGPLCDVRICLSRPSAAWSDQDIAAVVRDALAAVATIRTAIHVEGQRRLRAALCGL